MKGILFQPWKIKAIAANPDKEWQTRRTGGLDVLNRKTDFADQPNSPDEYSLLGFDGKVADFSRYAGSQGGMSIGIIYHLKPRYLSGETVYIKEAHHFHQTATEIIDGVKHPVVFYKARDTILSTSQWRNPRTMPAWAARYFIKITGVEACRTKDISFDDCLAEGVVDCPFWQNLDYKAPAPLHPENLTNAEADKEIDRGWIEYARQAYFALYDSINGKGAHERNWDWKYSFIPHSP